jgi:hypothetical protein
LGRSQQYRIFAARCVEIARAIKDEQTKAAMLQMAQVWSRIANEADALASAGASPSSDSADEPA